MAGYFLLKDIVVSVPQWATNQSESNFSSPSSFLPERWLSESSQLFSVQIRSERWIQALFTRTPELPRQDCGFLGNASDTRESIVEF